MVVPSGTIREEFVKHSRHSTATLISLTCDPFGLIESLTGQARAPVWRPPVLSVPGLDFPHFEARDSLPSAPIAAIKPPISAKDVCLCIKCRFVIQKCPFFSGQIVVVLFVFIQIPASIVINFFFPARPPRHFFPAAATMQPPRRGMICPAFSASGWAFVISSGRPGEGAAFRTPPFPLG